MHGSGPGLACRRGPSSSRHASWPSPSWLARPARGAQHTLSPFRGPGSWTGRRGALSADRSFGARPRSQTPPRRRHRQRGPQRGRAGPPSALRPGSPAPWLQGPRLPASPEPRAVASVFSLLRSSLPDVVLFISPAKRDHTVCPEWMAVPWTDVQLQECSLWLVGHVVGRGVSGNQS